MRRAVQAFLLNRAEREEPASACRAHRSDEANATESAHVTARCSTPACSVDCLRGIPQAQAVFEKYPSLDHRAHLGRGHVRFPRGPRDPTRDFLRGFERLAINEAIADRALSLIQRYERITMRHALPWATAQLMLSCT